jgi:nitrous oxide reductase accessory protein NosL
MCRQSIPTAVYRRTLLRTGGPLAAACALSGCLGTFGGPSGEGTPTPVDLPGAKFDDRGGMAIGEHGGPNGQIFYEEHGPDGHENSAWFHTLAFGLFPYYFEHRREEWEATAIYATDYSKLEYSLEEGSMIMPAPTAAETFGDATELTYVMESSVSGGMGPALVPFSVASDAESFVAEYGGRTVTFEEISSTLIANYTR